MQPATSHPSELSVVAHFAVHAGWVFAAAVNEQPSSGSHPILSELMEQKIDAVHVASFPFVHWHEPVYKMILLLLKNNHHRSKI